jgi:hypothetical protein
VRSAGLIYFVRQTLLTESRPEGKFFKWKIIRTIIGLHLMQIFQYKYDGGRI